MKQMCTKTVCSFLVIVMLLGMLLQSVSAADTENAIVSPDISMNAGASIRIADDYGIRFEATVSKLLFESYGEENIRAGMILAPADRIGSSDFTDAALGEGNYIKIPSSGWFSENTDGSKSFRAALVGFPKTEEAVTLNISARAYVEVTDGKGNTSVFWSAFDGASNTRSLHDVALLASQSSAEYAENQVIKDIIALAGTRQLPFSYVQQIPEAYIATMGMNSFRFNESYAASDDDRSQTVQVKSNLSISVGQKIEFDYRYIQTSASKTGTAFFWLMDGTRQLSECGGKVYSTMQMEYMQTPTMNRCYFGPNTSGPTQLFVQGDNLHWDWKTYHITIELLPGTENALPQFVYTIAETGRNDALSAKRISYAEQKEMSNVTLVFAARHLSYEISNLTVKSLDESQVASLFSLTGNLDQADLALIDIGTDRFQYQAGFSDAQDLRNKSIVRVNVPLKVGQKIEFDYTWKKSSKGDGRNWSETYFWFDDANSNIKDFWQHTPYASAFMFYWGGGCDVQKAAFTNKIIPNDADKSKFTDGLKGDGRNMHWDVQKYHITVEIREGTNGGNPQFVYTFTELERDDPRSCTIVYTAQTTAANLTNITLNFSSLWVSYEISNISVSDLA